jgi:hypothetical protein
VADLDADGVLPYLPPGGGDVLEHVAAVVAGRGERGARSGAARRKRRIAATDGDPHGKERGRGGRDPVAGRGFQQRPAIGDSRSVEMVSRRPGS